MVMIRLYLICIVLSCVTNELCAIEILDNKIVIPQGKLVGLWNVFNNYKKYLGIPYASVPGRFEEPSNPPAWTGTLYATKNMVKCNQITNLLNIPVGREDCQLLNVYTPAHRVQGGHSVMIFIHGGGFYWGSSTEFIYYPNYLVQKGVVVVTLNYRLGAFGFLCLHKKEAPGNVGLKDQVAALRWVQNNIKHFGGNPNSVTLFGQSAGSAAVNFHILSPLSQGLFHRAIMQSGSILTPLAFDKDPINTASEVASRMGFNTSDPEKLLYIFKNASATDIIRASTKNTLNDALAPYLFAPCVEMETKNAMINKIPEEMLKSAQVDPNMKLIVGYNNKEGIYYANRYKNDGVKVLNNYFADIIPDNIDFATDKDKRDFIKQVKQFYFKNSIINNDYESTDNLIDYFSDSIVHYPSMATTELLLKNTNISVYNYYFTYDSTRNLMKFITDYRTRSGASHGDELFYLFDPIPLRFLPKFSNDREFIDKMTTMWTDFAKTGNPTSNIREFKWKNSERDHLRYLEIGNNIKMTSLPNKQRMAFWKSIYHKYNDI